MIQFSFFVHLEKSSKKAHKLSVYCSYYSLQFDLVAISNRANANYEAIVSVMAILLAIQSMFSSSHAYWMSSSNKSREAPYRLLFLQQSG